MREGNAENPRGLLRERDDQPDVMRETTTRSTAQGRGQDRAGRIAIALLVAAPAAFIPGGQFRFVLPKLLVLATGVLLATFAIPSGRLPRAVSVVLVAGAAWLALAAALSTAPLAQFLGRWPRYEGLVALPVYIGAVWAGARLLGPTSGSRRLKTFYVAVAVMAMALALVSVLEWLGLRPLGGEAVRPGAFLGNATDQGVVGMLALLVLALPALRKRRPVAVLGALSGVLTTALSGSRAALGGAVIGLVILLVAELTSARAKERQGRKPVTRSSRSVAVGLGVVAALLIGVSLLVPGSRSRVLGTDTLAITSVSGRLLLWEETVALVADAPLVGVGPSGFVDAIPAAHSRAWAVQVGADNPPDSPHSWLLQALTAGGWPLMLGALVLAGLVVVIGIRNYKASLTDAGPRPHRDGESRSDFLLGTLAALAGYATALMAQFTTAGTVSLAALLAGGLVARAVQPEPCPGDEAPSREPSARMRGWSNVSRVIAMIWIAALTLGVAAEPALARAVDRAARGDVDTADALFLLSSRLRPWDRDVALIATQAFGPGTVAGDRPSAALALEWSARALRATPDSEEAGRVRAIALGVLGDAEQGLELADALLGRDPFNTQLLLAAGVLSAQAGDLHSAQAHFRLAAELDPDDPVVWSNLVIIYRMQGLSDEASAAEDRLNQLAPGIGSVS